VHENAIKDGMSLGREGLSGPGYLQEVIMIQKRTIRKLRNKYFWLRFLSGVDFDSA
jgi:hypothetical protein